MGDDYCNHLLSQYVAADASEYRIYFLGRMVIDDCYPVYMVLEKAENIGDDLYRVQSVDLYTLCVCSLRLETNAGCTCIDNQGRSASKYFKVCSNKSAYFDFTVSWHDIDHYKRVFT